jgi:hypothetical protein
VTAILGDVEVDPIIRKQHQRMIVRFLHQVSELFPKSLNLGLGLGKIVARGIELALEGLNILGIALMLTRGANQHRHDVRSSSEKRISTRYQPQRIGYSVTMISKGARKKLKSLNKK